LILLSEHPSEDQQEAERLGAAKVAATVQRRRGHALTCPAEVSLEGSTTSTTSTNPPEQRTAILDLDFSAPEGRIQRMR
jgi:hypothetical protein